MMEFLNQCGPIGDRMNSLLRHELDIEALAPTASCLADCRGGAGFDARTVRY